MTWTLLINVGIFPTLNSKAVILPGQVSESAISTPLNLDYIYTKRAITELINTIIIMPLHFNTQFTIFPQDLPYFDDNIAINP